MKIKEKIDKCVKEKLVDFCNVLNIPINKTSKKKVSGGLKFFHPSIILCNLLLLLTPQVLQGCSDFCSEVI